MEEIENMDNFGPHVSGCLAKPPPKLNDSHPNVPCARADVKIRLAFPSNLVVIRHHDCSTISILLKQ